MSYRENIRREREREPEVAEYGDDREPPERTAFHHPRTSLGGAAFYRPSPTFGVAGHLVYTAGALAPLVIGELIEDPKQRWRWTRLASVATALAFETLHIAREQKRRADYEARLAECRSRG
jgi:hypothetical protein